MEALIKSLATCDRSDDGHAFDHGSLEAARLCTATDEQLVAVASTPMSPEQWDQLEAELRRRAAEGSTFWTI